ncbi:MAG TPA: M15 family metallopeptidase [Candidatus Paceibacterota bacterium]
MKVPQLNTKEIIRWSIFVILLVSLIFSIYQYTTLVKKTDSTQTALTEELAQAQQKYTDITKENKSLYEALFSEQQKNQAFEKQINDIANTVGTLEKLSKTDPELLQKYSKVYFLNEHYMPEKLILIDKNHLSQDGKEEYIQENVWPYLRRMIEDINEDNLTLKILSAFRSFDSQTSLKSNYTITYGTGANQFSADQGYSEHQLGTTVDFTTEKMGPTLSTSFENTDEYTWLLNNAHHYGFILSYPKDNTYYEYEPWHWRFVGVALATKLYDEGKHFYDLDQREINPYLVNIFD